MVFQEVLMVDITLKWFCSFLMVVVMKLQVVMEYQEYVQDSGEAVVE